MLWIGFVASLLIHSLIWTRSLNFLELGNPAPAPVDNTPIEITDMPPPPVPSQKAQAKQQPKLNNKEKQVVETEDLNHEIDQNAKYLSEHNQKAEKQTRAKNVDDFRKKQGTGQVTNETTPEHPLPLTIPPTGEEQKEALKEHSEVGTNIQKPSPENDKKTGVKRDWKTLSLKDLSVTGDGGVASASDDKLDAPDGDRTILSTREFKFFSYYHRMKELLRQYWKPNVEAKLYSMWARGKTVNSDELTTQLLVTLDEKGNIQKVATMGSSGIIDLDQAAVEAFQKAAPFPNPPKGMVDADGFVRIRWDFILRAEAGPLIQFRSPGSAAP